MQGFSWKVFFEQASFALVLDSVFKQLWLIVFYLWKEDGKYSISSQKSPFSFSENIRNELSSFSFSLFQGPQLS